MTPSTAWFDLWCGGVEAAADPRWAELMLASGTVIGDRGRLFAAALRDPAQGDYAEFGRMVPEKIAAFAEAGASVCRDVQALQASAIAGWSAGVDRVIAGESWGWGAADAAAAWRLSAEHLARSIGIAGRAVAPIHRTATANARRLRAGRGA